MEKAEKNQGAQIQALQDKLKDHASRVHQNREKVRTEQEQIRERIVQKMTTAQENRSQQLTSIQEKLKDHEKHISEVLEAASKFSAEFSTKSEVKHVTKMETAISNREDYLKGLMDRLQDHERHVKEVQSKKPATSETNGDS